MKAARALLVTLGLAALAIAATPATAEIGPWVEAPNVRVRLVSSGQEGGLPVAGLEIVLEPGWKTYWRTPGDGGLAPNFDFSASWNIAGIEVRYPWPHRHIDGASVSNIYEGRVLFPIDVTPEMPGAPAMLNLTLDIGVCDVICIPVQLQASLLLSAGRVDAEALRLIDEARALVPVAPTPDFTAAWLGVRGFSPRVIDLEARVAVPQPFGAELFVEAPTNWVAMPAHQIRQEGEIVVFGFALQRPAIDTPLAGTRLRLTTVSGNAAVEQWVTIP
jgi:DsbC/DsbD-like thiol-disulfide interchange protein